jgi:hypothetical protein
VPDSNDDDENDDEDDSDIEEEDVNLDDDDFNEDRDANDDLNDIDDEDVNDGTGDDEDDEGGLIFPTLLPLFSKKIENSLKDGDCWIEDKSRAQLIRELGIFFTTGHFVINKSRHYKAICLTLLSKKIFRKIFFFFNYI